MSAGVHEKAEDPYVAAPSQILSALYLERGFLTGLGITELTKLGVSISSLWGMHRALYQPNQLPNLKTSFLIVKVGNHGVHVEIRGQLVGFSFLIP